MDETARQQFALFAGTRMPALLRLAHLIVGDHQAAQDVVQDAFVRLCRSWPRVERSDNPDAYVRKAVVNAAVDRSRKRVDQPIGDWIMDADVRPGPDLDSAIDLRRFLAELPPRQRAVVVLRFYADLTEQDTAATLGISVGTVKSQTARALTSLRSRIEPKRVSEAAPCR